MSLELRYYAELITTKTTDLNVVQQDILRELLRRRAVMNRNKTRQRKYSPKK